MKKKHGKKTFKSYKRKKPSKPFEGVFSANQAGFGFVTPIEADMEDIFIPPKYTGGALDGDKVEVRIIEDAMADASKRGPVGKILTILERGRQFVVAELNSRYTARPLDKKLPEEIRVNSAPRNIGNGQWVRLRLLNDGKKHTEKLRASVEEGIGKAGTVEGDLQAVIAEYGLPHPYSPENDLAASKITPLEIEREDLTSFFTVTIDPADAKDFDDAVSIMPGGKKTEFLLGVHIADVAAWIKPGSKFDKEAAKRAFSSYIPAMFSPMLPKTLTAMISLRENVESLAHSVIFTVRKSDGKIISSRRVRSKIKVNKRLNFEEVQSFINSPSSAPKNWNAELKKKLTDLIALFRKMREYRAKTEEFLNIETSEVRVLCDDETKRVIGIERKTQGEADQLVEEFMLAANSAIANELIERSIPGLFRVHAEPVPEKMDEFSSFVDKVFHLRIGDLLASRKACIDFLNSIPDDHRKPVILSHFLRSLPRAVYHAEPSLHYGLGKYRYSHFTSPIRRYPDLIVHQQLLAADLNTKLRSKKLLAGIATDCSAKEENNDNAFFAANDRLKIHYLRESGALENAIMYEAVINKVNSGGLLCDIPELGIYGFVPREKIRGGEFSRSHCDKNRLRASRGHTEYKVGDFVYLMLDSIDTVRGVAIFRPAV